jgi:hypothetical protein
MHSKGWLALVISSACVQFASAQAAGTADVETALRQVSQDCSTPSHRAIRRFGPAICTSAAYEGTYALTEEILATVRCTSQGLLVEREARPPPTYVAELEDVFFVPGQPRTRRIFQRDSRGGIVGFVDRREGEDVRWVKRPR